MESFRQWICEVHIMRLEAKNLSFSYDVKGRQILRQFSLSADSSERVNHSSQWFWQNNSV